MDIVADWSADARDEPAGRGRQRRSAILASAVTSRQ
jgi:hypothetical protein